MTNGVVADTHAVIWYLDAPEKLSPDATLSLDSVADDEKQQIFISAITLIEMHYLTEKGRIKPAVLLRVLAEIDSPQPILSVVAVDRRIADHLAAIDRTIVPDMPDRIIAATALAFGLPLVTQDAQVRALKNIATIW